MVEVRGGRQPDTVVVQQAVRRLAMVEDEVDRQQVTRVGEVEAVRLRDTVAAKVVDRQQDTTVVEVEAARLLDMAGAKAALLLDIAAAVAVAHLRAMVEAKVALLLDTAAAVAVAHLRDMVVEVVLVVELVLARVVEERARVG